MERKETERNREEIKCTGVRWQPYLDPNTQEAQQTNAHKHTYTCIWIGLRSHYNNHTELNWICSVRTELRRPALVVLTLTPTQTRTHRRWMRTGFYDFHVSIFQFFNFFSHLFLGLFLLRFICLDVRIAVQRTHRYTRTTLQPCRVL